MASELRHQPRPFRLTLRSVQGRTLPITPLMPHFTGQATPHRRRAHQTCSLSDRARSGELLIDKKLKAHVFKETRLRAGEVQRPVAQLEVRPSRVLLHEDGERVALEGLGPIFERAVCVTEASVPRELVHCYASITSPAYRTHCRSAPTSTSQAAHGQVQKVDRCTPQPCSDETLPPTRRYDFSFLIELLS